MDDRVKSSCEGLIDIVLFIGSKYHQSLAFFDTLEQDCKWQNYQQEYKEAWTGADILMSISNNKAGKVNIKTFHF